MRCRAAAAAADDPLPASEAAAGVREGGIATRRAVGIVGEGDGGKEKEHSGGEAAAREGGGEGEGVAGGGEWVCLQQVGAVFPSSSGPQVSLAGLIPGSRYLLQKSPKP